jgi:hypothetical protein
MSKKLNKLCKYSYGILNFNQHNIFITNNTLTSPIYQPYQEKIKLFSNIEQLKTHIIKNHLHKSCVLYKFDNDINPLFSTQMILYENVISYKKIHFDVNRINEYFDDIENLNKHFDN